jgi:outer membrane protein assembly factor BamB
MTLIQFRRACMLALAAGLLARPTMQTPADWPQWRGPERDGISKETGLLQSWPPGGPPLLWKTSGAGIGYSSISVAGGRLFTQGANARSEFVVAFDVTTGKRLWETIHGGRYENEMGDGPRGTPTVDGARLYAVGGNGSLVCLDAASGKTVWSRSLTKDFGGDVPPWGYSESPLIVGERLLVAPGGDGSSVVALNKNDGSLIWKSGSDPAAYSSAILHRVGSVSEVVYFTGDRALGLHLDDGRLLWSYTRVANRTANIATPIARGNRIFVSSDYGTGAALLDIQPSAGGGLTAKEVYFTRDMRNHHSTSVLVGEHLYGFSSTILTAMRFDSGTVAWRDRSVGKGSLVYADQRLYLFGEDGTVGLAEANPTAYREHGRFSLKIGYSPSWAHPVVSGGRLFLRDQDALYAYDVRGKR